MLEFFGFFAVFPSSFALLYFHPFSISYTHTCLMTGGQQQQHVGLILVGFRLCNVYVGPILFLGDVLPATGGQTQTGKLSSFNMDVVLI